jgi:hypothetical protein
MEFAFGTTPRAAKRRLRRIGYVLLDGKRGNEGLGQKQTVALVLVPPLIENRSMIHIFVRHPGSVKGGRIVKNSESCTQFLYRSLLNLRYVSFR